MTEIRSPYFPDGMSVQVGEANNIQKVTINDDLGERSFSVDFPPLLTRRNLDRHLAHREATLFTLHVAGVAESDLSRAVRKHEEFNISSLRSVEYTLGKACSKLTHGMEPAHGDLPGATWMAFHRGYFRAITRLPEVPAAVHVDTLLDVALYLDLQGRGIMYEPGQRLIAELNGQAHEGDAVQTAEGLVLLTQLIDSPRLRPFQALPQF